MDRAEPTVLVVSQQPDREELRAALKRTSIDLDVVSVGDVPSAKTVLERRRVDCIVSDYEVPDADGRVYMGGPRLLEDVRAEHGNLPLVIVTDIVNEDSVRQAVTEGVSAYIRDTEGEDVIRQLSHHVETAVTRRRAERRAEELAHINEIIRDVNESLVRERTREAMIERICRQLTDDDVYRSACFGFVDRETGELDGWTMTDDAARHRVLELETSQIVTEAMETRTLQFQRQLVTDDRDGPGVGAARQDTVTRIAVPVAYEDDCYGVLVLETSRSHTFYETERDVLGELGETIGHALNAVEVRRSLRRHERERGRQERRLETVERVVSGDIDRPLDVARERLEEIRTDEDAPALPETFDGLDRIEAAVADVLAIVTTGQSGREPRRVDLHSVVEDAWAAVETSDAAFVIGDLPAVEADPAHLQLVLETVFRRPAGGREDGATVRVSLDGEDVVVEDERDREETRDVASGATTDADATDADRRLAVLETLADQVGLSVDVTATEDGGTRTEIRGLTVAER